MKPVLKDGFLWIYSAVGTLVFVFCMMSAINIFTRGINTFQWTMPCFVLPAYLFCVTFGANYWVGKDSIRREAYWISTIVVMIFFILVNAFWIPDEAELPVLRWVSTVLLTCAVILYSVLKVRKNRKTNQRIDMKESTTQGQFEQLRQRKAFRLICLLSICCVVLESWHRTIRVLYGLAFQLIDSISFDSLVQLLLSILSAILLARFIMAEFVQRDVPKPEATELG